MEGSDGAGLAPADHHRHQCGQPERCHVRAGPVRGGAGYVADHPQQGRDGAARRKRRPVGAAQLSAQCGEGRRHGRLAAGRDRGTGAGRGRAAPRQHPLWPCYRGAAGPESPGADAGRDPAGPREGLPHGLGGLLPCPAGAGDRRGQVPGRRLQRQHAHRPCQKDGGRRTGVRGPGGGGHHPPQPHRSAHHHGAQLLGAGRHPAL